MAVAASLAVLQAIILDRAGWPVPAFGECLTFPVGIKLAFIINAFSYSRRIVPLTLHTEFSDGFQWAFLFV